MKRRISAKFVSEDIRSGLSEAELIGKYGLSPEGLQSLFKGLVQVEIVTHQYLYKRFPSYRERTGQLGQPWGRIVGLSLRLPVK